MSVSLQEVIESAGYDLTTRADCVWLLSKKEEFELLCEKSEQTIEELDEILTNLESENE